MKEEAKTFYEERRNAGRYCVLNVDAFRDSLTDATPPEDASLALQALWWAGKGDWDQAHRCAQMQEGDPDCDLVHAHLHRQEGDLANAGHWYRRARLTLPDMSLQQEWTAIATQLLV